MASANLTEERLERIERGARERHMLMDRVVLELVEEVRRLREIVASIEGRQGHGRRPSRPEAGEHSRPA